MSKDNQLLIKEIFIDRTNELKMLITGLKSAKDFVLIAPRRFGKTTLVNKAFDTIRKDDDYILISIDMMRYAESIRRLAEAITEHCLNALGYKGKLQLLLKQVGLSLQLKMSFGELEIEPILSLFQNKSDDLALLGHALELFEKIAIKTHKVVIVFFDEFGELYSLGEEVVKIFRSVLQTQKHAGYVFAGSQATLMSKIFVEKNSAFYRFGDIIKLGNLNQKEVFHFLNQTDFNSAVSQNILSFLECHPYYTSKVIRDLILEPEFAVSEQAFFRYIQNRLLPQESSYLEMVIQHIKSRAHTFDVLADIASQAKPNVGLEDIPRQTIYQLSKNLEQRGYIYKSNGQYQLTDPLLKIYLSQ